MSGGERKKRAERGEGWEEAGGEFYQESYPGEMDLDHVLQRDPHHLATLLPSKHTRTTATRKKETKATLRRKTSTRSYYGTTRLNTTGANNEVQVSIMPDLSENLSNEERTWEEIMKLKTLPISMSEKKEMKAQLLSAETFRMQGWDQLKWQKKKLFLHIKTRWKQLNNFFSIWDKNLQNLEKDCGTGIVSFFTFTKWLIFLNLSLCWFIFKFIVVPTYIFNHNGQSIEVLLENNTGSVAYCSSNYQNVTDSIQLKVDTDTIFSFVQGTGWIQSTPLFYAHYMVVDVKILGRTIKFSFIYIGIIMCYYFGIFVSLVKQFVNSFEQRLLKNQGQYYLFCNLVFSSWDFSIGTKKAALARHKSVFTQIKEFLKIQKQKEEKLHRTADESFKLAVIRFTVNLIVLLILFCAGAVVYYVIQYSLTPAHTYRNQYEILMTEYIPAATIVCLNFIVPEIFNYFIVFESYNSVFTKRVSLIRALILRLLLLGVLVVSIFNFVNCKPNENECTSANCKAPSCWESYFGQQMFKLLLFNLVFELALTFLINFPRKLLTSSISNRFGKLIEHQTFNVPKHILDIAYIQIICWLAVYYAPLFPLLTTVVMFFTFYITKFSCMVNCSPSCVLYPASELRSLFVFVLSASFIFSLVPWIYVIFEIMPSKSCGPFRGQASVWSVLLQIFYSFPPWVKVASEFSSSTWFIIPIILTLICLLYYYYSVSVVNQQMVLVLKKQLILEGHDKQFLLNRLSAFIKQQQEKHKAMARSVDGP